MAEDLDFDLSDAIGPEEGFEGRPVEATREIVATEQDVT